ncbi:hypothetical protein BDW22DRAFT_227493 [Trametopsis cervina]|nr:hypothetical protein BDW22DRAFT_227493 [Trametopsis cervina]
MSSKPSTGLGGGLLPFQIARNNHLVVLHVQADFDHCQSLSFLSFDLLRIAEETITDTTRAGDASSSIMIPWDSWGVQHTRGGMVAWRDSQSSTAYGLKHTFLETLGDSIKLVVRDFNPQHVRWQSHMRDHDVSQCTALHPLPADSQGRVTLAEDSTDHTFEGYFEREPGTLLPYVEWASACDLEPDADQVMVSEDWIVVLKFDFFHSEARGFEIYSI